MRGKRKYPWQRRRLKVLIIAGAIVAIVFGGFASWRGYLNRRLDVEYAKIREAGYPITGEELAAWYESTPTTLDGEALYEQAFEAYSGWPEESDADSAFAEAEKAYDKDGTITEEGMELFRGLLEAKSEAIALLHEAATKGPTRFPMYFPEDDLLTIEFPHLAKLRDGARLLSWKAVLSAREGDAEEALHAIESMWWVAESVAFEPIIFSLLVRLICHAILFDTLDDVLDYVELSEGQLLHLSERFGATQLTVGIEMYVAGERCSALQAFEQPQLLVPGVRTDTRISEKIWKGSSRYVDAVIGSTGIFEADRLVYLGLMDRVLEATGQDYHDAGPYWASIKEDIDKLSPLRNGITLMVLHSPARIAQNISRTDAHTRIALTVFAIERFRLSEDGLPTALDELVPTYMDAIPTDPFNGLPLKYITSPEAYSVYSIGMNEKDQGGYDAEKESEGDLVLRVAR